MDAVTSTKTSDSQSILNETTHRPIETKKKRKREGEEPQIKQESQIDQKTRRTAISTFRPARQESPSSSLIDRLWDSATGLRSMFPFTFFSTAVAIPVEDLKEGNDQTLENITPKDSKETK